MNLPSKLLALFSFLIFSQIAIAEEQPALPAENRTQSLEELKVAIEKIRKETNTPAVG